MAGRRLRRVLGHLAPHGASEEAEPPRQAGQEVGPWPAREEDDGTCGASEGYPMWESLVDLWSDRAAQQYLRAGCAVCPRHRVGNYAGLPGEAGFEKVFNYNTIAASGQPSPLTEAPPADGFSYEFGGRQRRPDDYLDDWDATALLISRDGRILSEHYRHERTADMRFTSWSMAKSVTSLLLGICIDRGLIASLDDTAETYVPEFRGTELGSCTLRNLSNMSSGVEVTHERDNPTIYPCAFWGPGSDIKRVVAGWQLRREPQGQTFNYTELCPITVGAVIREVTGGTMSELAEEALWGPLGAEAEASWCTDSTGSEYNCVNFACRLRDWARLGRLIAQRGEMEGRRIVSEAWIDEITSWGESDGQVRHGTPPLPGGSALNDLSDFGYKSYIWHLKPDGSRPMFNGAHGQRVIIDMNTKAVVVQTAVTTESEWLPELVAMLDRAGEL